ncbi:MAG: hypothetical protein HZA53_16475, partial [Planctomycetes bacterium]|nr:hypothetical protein [Planctomycetota bacterium]
MKIDARSRARALALLLAACVGPAASTVAFAAAPRPITLGEQDFASIEGKVTSISGASIYVDRGRDDHVEVGDRVRLYPPGVTSVEGTIRSVAKNSARLELDPGSAAVVEGARIEVLVPRERLAKPTPPVKPPDAAAPAPPPVQPKPDAGAEVPPMPPPVHPPRTQPPENWAADQ